MGLINPKPRFGYDPEQEMIYDYQGQRDLPIAGLHQAHDGVWDLLEVKRLILGGQPVEAARVGESNLANATSPPQPPPNAPVPDAGLAAANILNEGFEPAKPTAGLSVAELHALKLSALQSAALGITPTQLTQTGVTREQVAAWGLNAARADALKLTAEQRAALMPA